MKQKVCKVEIRYGYSKTVKELLILAKDARDAYDAAALYCRKSYWSDPEVRVISWECEVDVIAKPQRPKPKTKKAKGK